VVLSLRWRLQILPKAPSTQDIIKNAAEAGEDEGVVVHALMQGQGRGRHGREWVSQPGNLFFSFLLRPQCAVRDIGLLSLLVGIGTARALRSYVDRPEDLRLKWPNDILLKGKKCAGILLESETTPQHGVAWAAVGVGVNAVDAPPEGSFLQSCGRRPVDIGRLRDNILREVAALYTLWRAGNHAQIREEWMSMACAPGTPVTVKTGLHSQKGRFHDIDEYGSLLLLDDENRLVKVTAGDVYM
jgi:BirA family biotin operon repressor/biotin-[acetyl-CoA-carboxylase] ligase